MAVVTVFGLLVGPGPVSSSRALLWAAGKGQRAVAALLPRILLPVHEARLVSLL